MAFFYCACAYPPNEYLLNFGRNSEIGKLSITGCQNNIHSSGVASISSMPGLFLSSSSFKGFCEVRAHLLSHRYTHCLVEDEQLVQDYAYAINMPYRAFVFAALLIMAITLITISFQSIRAVLMNPVKSLRSK